MRRGDSQVMSLPTSEVRAIELQIRQFCVDWFAADDIRIRVTEQFMVEYAARVLRADMWLPAQILSEDRVIAAWPINLWAYIRKALGLKYARTTIRLNEFLLSPKVSIPSELSKVGTHVYVKYVEQMEMPSAPRDW